MVRSVVIGSFMFVLAAAAAVGCGSKSGGDGGGDPEGVPVDGAVDYGNDQGEAPIALAVADNDARPECTDGNESQLIYVIAKKTFQVCHGGSWGAIEIAGKDGEKGEAGEDGVDGAAGVDGSAGPKGDSGADGQDGKDGTDGGQIVSIVSCGQSQDIGVSDYRYGMYLKATTYANGAVSLACMSAKWAVGETGLDTSSMTADYPSDSNGVLAGEISCVPFYVAADFHVDSSSVTYTNLGDDTSTETVACTEIYDVD
jgi:hypothetical protein